ALEVPGPALAEAARTAVLEQALPAGAAADPVWRAAELSLTCVDPGPAVVADGALALHVSRVSGTPPGSMTAAVDIVVDGAVRRTVMVRCDALVALDVPVVTAPVARHDALTEDNVAVERREFASLPRGLLLPEAVLAGPGAGLRATRPLTPGTVLTDSMVEAAPVVLRGAPVTIVAATARIHVAAPGVALEDGRVGDVIRVQNSLSGQVIRARVAAADRGEAIVPGKEGTPALSIRTQWRLPAAVLALIAVLAAWAPAAGATSLWSEGDSLFSDRKARRVGDLVTIIIVERAQATQSTATQAGQDAALQLGPISLADIVPVIPPISASGSDSNAARGSTTRGGSLNARMTAQVVDVLPNGNLLIEGRQTIIVNEEEQIIVVSGIVRPQDIAPDNTVLSTFIADATITYSGTGPIAEKQKPVLLTRLLNWLF